jgi:hypothetical protein
VKKSSMEDTSSMNGHGLVVSATGEPVNGTMSNGCDGGQSVTDRFVMLDP